MKRKYEVCRVIPARRELKILVIVHELGPTWSFDLSVPYEMLDGEEIYNAIALEQERMMRYQARHDAFEHDALF